jgi:hypothetical protein
MSPASQLTAYSIAVAIRYSLLKSIRMSVSGASAPAVMSALYSNVTAFGLLGVLSGLWLQTIPPHRLDCTGLASDCKTSRFAALFCIFEPNIPFDAISGKVGSPFRD